MADVEALINGVGNDLDFEIVEEIVNEDEKQRYSFNDDKTLIKANQGHSIPVDVELEEVEPPAILWHGSATKYEESIDRDGLQHKQRLYVHLSKDKETAIKVGARHGKPVLYWVLAQEMRKAGLRFLLSKMEFG